MVLVASGSFEMGSPPIEAGREPQEVQHHVEITHPFYMGATEVTQAQWRAVMGGNPSWFAACGADCPVERVSWNDVQSFLAALRRSTGKPFRLPTEAEWEYSCRAGSSTPFHTGTGLSTDQANYDGEGPYDGAKPGRFRRSTTPVASFAPNAFGLYDMHGNVWEWTQDWHCPYPTTRVRDPLGVCRTPFKVIRGGSWYFDASSARCALRYIHRPQDSGFSIGFRVALAADAVPPPGSAGNLAPMLKKNRSAPDAAVIPVLHYPDVREAVEWLTTNLPFTERLRIAGHRCQLLHGNSALIVAEARAQDSAAPSAPQSAGSHSVMLRVTGIDQLFARAKTAGARVLAEPADHMYGERQCSFVDPWGHPWTLSETIFDSDPADWGGELVAD